MKDVYENYSYARFFLEATRLHKKAKAQALFFVSSGRAIRYSLFARSFRTGQQSCP